VDRTANATIEETVRILFDVEKIKKLQARYFRFLDQREWNGFAELFTEDVTFDYPTLGAHRGREKLLELVKESASKGNSTHHGHMPEIEILSSTSASGVWALADNVDRVDASGQRVALEGSAYYFEEYVKHEDDWRISSLRLVRTRLQTTTSYSAPIGERA
jgi:hypothetical protein